MMWISVAQLQMIEISVTFNELKEERIEFKWHFTHLERWGKNQVVYTKFIQ